MPTAVKGAKGRVPLFQTLDRARAHFITVSSASESGSERDIGEESEYDEERIALSTAGEGGDKTRRLRLEKQQPQHKSESAPPDLDTEEQMSMRYSRVTTNDGDSSPITEAEHTKRRRSQLAERISNKLHALFWAVVGIMVAYHTDFLRVLMEDERVNRLWFNVGIVCFGINIIIMLYLTVWLPYIKGIRVSWNVYSPRAIPTATVVGLVCAITLNVGLWNVWGFLTPLILFAVFIGCLFSLHFIPWPC